MNRTAYILFFPILIGLIILCRPALPQQQAGPAYQFNDLIIQASRPLHEKGITKTNIDTLVFREKLNASLAELFTLYSPVFIKSYGQGSLATASFRGTAASHTRVEWNGITINSPMLGQVDFSLIPVQFTDNINLYHGGSSLQNGSGALGGSVTIETRPQWDKKFYGSVIQGLASFHSYQHFISLGGGSKKLQTRIRYFHEQSENNFRFYNNANGLWDYERQQNADFKKNSLLGEIYLNAGKNHFVSLNIWGQVADRNLPSIMSYEGADRKEKQKDEEFRLVGKWSKYGTKIKSVLTSGFSGTNLHYFLANNTGYGSFVSYDTRSVSNSLYNKYELVYQPSRKLMIKTLLNYNFHKVFIHDNIDLTGYDAHRHESGASTSLHYSFRETLSAYILVREEYVDRQLTPVMPSGGVEWQPFRHIPVNLRTNITRNYHQPTLNDLYWLPGGNPDLKPEEGYTADIGLDYSLRKDSLFSFSTGLTAYVSHINDWIIWQPSEFRYWTAENLKTVFARGIEYTLKGSYTLRKWIVGLQGNYTYTRTTNEGNTSSGDNSKGKQLIYIPLHKANTLLYAEYARLYMSYTFAYLSERYTTSSNEDTRHSLPAFSLHHFSLGKKFTFGKLSGDIQFKVNNLTDKNYQAILWRAMPGRHYAIFIKLSF